MAKGKIFHLGVCKTCQKILNQLDTDNCVLQDIKHESISPQQLDEIAKLAGSYEALFSRKAIKYRLMNLKDRKLTENDYRKLMLEEYTFLKRPIIVSGKEIFIGSTKAEFEKAKRKLS